ncbi:Serine/threonine kinase mps1 [Coemansia helicoidea]|uniref:Serine/threonine kinase mps1 n=1 Tax=Coemansia helicoidea TaxID=1286919 RepID=A0ACC1LEV1_9FUNG|nr:Serine/threonine kinase mps1 [Coemansia helicoidea]
MPLYGYGAGHRGKAGPPAGPVLYPPPPATQQKQPPGRQQGTRLFDLSMDDLDDFDSMSDLENLNYTKISSRPVDIPQPTPRDAPRRSSRSPRFRLASPPRDGGSNGSHMTLHSDDDVPPSPPDSRSAAASGTLVERRDGPRSHTPGSHRPADADAADDTKLGGAAHAASATETPAYKLPPHPTTQGSTVTTRWKRRGRLGLAKPQRNDSGPAADDTSGHGDGAGLESSPPGPLGFLVSAASAADQRHSDLRLARSPPRSVVSGFDSMESIDEAASAEADHTFLASRVRLAGRSAASLYGSRESVHPPGSDGSAEPARAASLDGSAVGNNTMDISDVSMASGPQSPEPEPAPKPPSSAGSDAPPKDMQLSAGRRAAAGSREFLQSESARRRAMSPLVGRSRAPIMARSPGARTPDGTDPAGSPKHQWEAPAAHESPRPASQEKRPGPAGEPAMDISTRFQQYEQRLNDVSPHYRSPRERQRILASSFVRSAEDGPAEPASAGSRDDPRSWRDAERQRSHGFAESVRPGDHHGPSRHLQQQPEERPMAHSAGYASPRLSARRAAVAAADNNFDVLRKTTPVQRQESERAHPASGSNPASARSDGRSTVSPLPVPAAEAKVALQEHYASAVVAAAQQQQQQQSPAAPPADEKPQQPPAAVQQQQPPAALGGVDPKRLLTVNGRPYQKISITGRGGSSKVYKAMSAKHEIFAIKRVSFSRADVQTIEGYMNEIILLRKFEGNAHIIQLFDAEVNKERGLLHMVMEFGETDLASVLKRGGARPLGMNVIRLYWEQMLRAVQTIHEERVVHADLKPANYLLVKGSLKLIDFGIAKAIGNDTTNIHRESQIGTVNYMSPEAIKENNPEGGRRVMKLGRASDIWSLGIILYQMCYGHTPFAQLALFKKLASIPDPSFVIPYPRYMAGCLQVGTDRDPNMDGAPRFADGEDKVPVPLDLLRVMQVCLQRDPAKRMSIPDLLTDPLLCPIALDEALPSAMSQMLSLIKRSPEVLDQWDVSDAQNEKVLASLVRALHQQERGS